VLEEEAVVVGEEVEAVEVRVVQGEAVGGHRQGVWKNTFDCLLLMFQG
jgi:hypothetical protein